MNCDKSAMISVRILLVVLCFLSFNTAIAQVPILDIGWTGNQFEKGGSPVDITDDDLSISDDDANMVSATITLTNRRNGSNEFLSLSGSFGNISITPYNSSTGVLQLTGSEVIAQYEAALEAITYNNVSVNPNNEDRIITIVVNDGDDGDSNTETSTITIKFPPVLTTIGPVETTVEETEIEISFLEIANNADDSDVDGTITAFVVQTVSSGTLEIGSTQAGATAFEATTNDIITSTLKAYWTPPTNQTGTLAAFTILARDNENLESSSPITVPVIVTEANDNPVANDDSGSTNQDTEVTISDITNNDTDVDNEIDPSTIILIDPNDGNNTGDANTPLVISGEGTYSIDASGNLTFTPLTSFASGGDTNAVVDYTVDDESGGTSNVATVTISVTQNTTPTLDLDDNDDSGVSGNGFETGYIQGFSGVQIAGNDTRIRDATDTNIESATITLTNRPDGINEVLFVNGNLPSGISVTDPYSNADGVLGLSGTASLADYQTAIELIEYRNDASTLDPAARIINVVVNDGTVNSLTAATTINSGCLQFQTFTFDNNPVEETWAGANGDLEGDTWRYNSVATIGGTVIDAIVELTDVQNATLEDMTATGGNAAENFQPQIRVDDNSDDLGDTNANGNGKGFIDFTITFVEDGTTTPFQIPNFAITAIDVDGDGGGATGAREFAGFVESPGITIESGCVGGGSGCTGTSNGNNLIRQDEGAVTVFASETTANQAGIDVNATENMAYTRYATRAEFTIRAGVYDGADGGGEDDRLFSFSFNPCLYLNYITPKTSPTSSSREFTINEDDSYDFDDLDIPFRDDDADLFDAVIITALPSQGTLLYNGSAVTATQVTNAFEFDDRDLFSYDPVANDSGTPYTTFTFRVKDDSNHDETEFSALVDTVTFNVRPVNDPPVAEPDTYTVSEGGTLTADDATGSVGDDSDNGVRVKGTTDDSDVDDVITDLTVVLISGPSNNANNFVLNPDGTFEYVHDGSETTVDSFTYQLEDPDGATSSIVTVTINITPVNDPPVLDLDDDNSSGATAADYFTNFVQGGNAVAVGDTDVDIDDPDDTNIESVTLILTNRPDGTDESLSIDAGDLLGSASVSDPYSNADGQLEISGTATLAQYQTMINSIVYENLSSDPDVADRNITIVINDGDNDSNTATANITVSPNDDFDNDGIPDADDLDDDNDGIPDTEEYCTDGGIACLTIEGDIDPSGDEDGDGVPNFEDSDDPNFTFTNPCTDVDMNGVCDTLTSDFDTDGDGIPNHRDLNSDGDSCPDAYEAGHGLTVQAGGTIVGPYGNNGLANSVETTAESGTLNYTISETQSSTYDAQNSAFDACDLQLDLDEDDSSGATAADYDTSFTEGDTDLAIVDTDVSITDANAVTIERVTIILTTRPDGTDESLSVIGTLPPGISITDPYNNADGQLVLSGTASLSSYETALKQIVYNNSSSDPDGADRIITVIANDGSQDSNTGTTTITVSSQNSAPVAVNDTNAITEGTTSVNQADGNGELDANDTDEDGDGLTVTQIGTETNAGVDITGTYGTLNWETDGSYVYTLNQSSVNGLKENEQVFETFTYAVSDGNGGTDTATLTITITGDNDAPVAVDDTNAMTTADGSVDEADGSGTLLVNDSDVDGDDLNVASITCVNGCSDSSNDPGTDVDGQYGTISWNNDGTYTYTLTSPPTLAIGEVALEEFDYVLTDAIDNDSGRLTITISGTGAELVISSTELAGDDTGAEGVVPDDGRFTIKLQDPSNGNPVLVPVGQTVTVNYSVSGTASSIDYDTTPFTGTIDITQGNSQVTIDVDVTNDTDAECSDETVIVTLLNTSDVVIGSDPGEDQATVTISDNDPVAIDLALNTICAGEDITVSITNASELPNGFYDFVYTIDGGGDQNANNVEITSGSGSFSISGVTDAQSIDVTAVCGGTKSVTATPVVAIVNSPSSASSITGTASICKGESTDLTISITGGQFPYTVVLSDGSSESLFDGGDANDNVISVSPSTTTSYTITSVTDANGCTGTGISTTPAVVTVNNGPTASSISGETTICNGDVANLVVDITGGASTYTVVLNDGSSDHTIMGYASGSNIVTGTDIPAISSTTSYTITSVTDFNGCAGTGNSGTVTITVEQLPNTNTLGVVVADFCEGGDATAALSGTLANGTYTVTYSLSGANSATDATATATISGGSGNGTFTIPSLNGQGTTTVSISNIANTTGLLCDVGSLTASNMFEVVADPSISVHPTANTTDCVGGTVNLSVSASVGAGGSIQYEWQSSSTSGSGFSTATGTNDQATYSVPTGTAGTMYYRVVVSDSRAGCTDITSSEAQVVLNEITSPGSISGAQTICVGDDPSALTSGGAATGTGSITYQWEQSTTSSSSGFSDIGSATGLTYDPGVLTQTTWFRRRAEVTGCTDEVTSAVEVTVNTPPNAGTASNQAVCVDGTSFDLFNGLAGNDSGGSWNDDDATGALSGNIFNPSVAGVGTYDFTYTVSGGGVCTDDMATVQVTVNALPTPTFTAEVTDVCAGTTGNVYTTQSGQSNYVWTVSSGGTITAGGTGTDNSVTVTWNTAGSRSVSVNYEDSNGCTA
ncbi:MAG: Ig-like domain-containing protein, partial [Cyclobacteriaceae bacterium]